MLIIYPSNFRGWRLISNWGAQNFLCGEIQVPRDRYYQGSHCIDPRTYFLIWYGTPTAVSLILIATDNRFKKDGIKLRSRQLGTILATKSESDENLTVPNKPIILHPETFPKCDVGDQYTYNLKETNEERTWAYRHKVTKGVELLRKEKQLTSTSSIQANIRITILRLGWW